MYKMTEEIRIKYQPGAHQLEQTAYGSWIDMYVYKDTKLKAGERKLISLGVSMDLPEGYEAMLLPRSSTFKQWGILQTNSEGVIDSTFCGDDDVWMFPALATRDVTIPKNTRICQFRIQEEQPIIKFVAVESLENEARGGFGSSGL